MHGVLFTVNSVSDIGFQESKDSQGYLREQRINNITDKFLKF